MAPKLSKLVTGTVYKNFCRGPQHFLLPRASTNLNPLLGVVIFDSKFTFSHPRLAWIIKLKNANIQPKFAWILFDRQKLNARNWFQDRELIINLRPNSVYPKKFLPNPKYSTNFWLQCSREAPLFPPMVNAFEILIQLFKSEVLLTLLHHQHDGKQYNFLFHQKEHLL